MDFFSIVVNTSFMYIHRFILKIPYRMSLGCMRGYRPPRSRWRHCYKVRLTSKFSYSKSIILFQNVNTRKVHSYRRYFFQNASQRTVWHVVFLSRISLIWFHSPLNVKLKFKWQWKIQSRVSPKGPYFLTVGLFWRPNRLKNLDLVVILLQKLSAQIS